MARDHVVDVHPAELLAPAGAVPGRAVLPGRASADAPVAAVRRAPSVVLRATEPQPRDRQQHPGGRSVAETIAIRSATRRVWGSAPAKNSRSHEVATSTENPDPISPSLSVFARSIECR